MSDDGRNGDGTFAEGNHHSLKHGIERSVKALASGGDLVGRAHDAELSVRSEIETEGVISLLRRNVCRAGAINDMIWDQIQAAVEHDDSEEFDRWVKRFGWLTGVVGRAIAQMADFEKGSEKGTSAQDVLDALRGDSNGNE